MKKFISITRKLYRKEIDKITTRQGDKILLFFSLIIFGKICRIYNEKNLCNLTALFGSMALSATAAPITENKAALPQQCTQLFKETENLIAQAEKQPGTHTQVGKIKSKLNQSKQQILEMELATQQKSCDVGLARLNSMKSYTEETN